MEYASKGVAGAALGTGIGGSHMDYKEEIKKLIDTIESEKLLEFIYKFIKDASVRWK